MDLVEAIRVLAIAFTAVVTCAALDAALACHWLVRHDPALPDARPPERGAAVEVATPAPP